MADSHAYYYNKEPSRFTHRHTDQLLVHCNILQASDVTIQTNEPVFAEIYGRLYPITRRALSNTEVSDIINGIYGPNGTTQLLTGTDIDTHYEVRPARHTRYRHRVNAVGIYTDGQQGIQITIRTIPTNPPSLSTMQLPESITKSISPKEGVVYITGATGSGKSTLLASIIKELAEEPDSNRKILTYEAPIEFVYDAVKKPASVVSQTEIPKHLPSFAAGVRNALRRKPHVILVGEARDPETISAVLEAALTGHPVYTTLHANGVAETIRRLVGAFAKEERTGKTIDIIETLRLIIWQRLAPTVDGKRVALREYLVFDEALRDSLLSKDPTQITANVRKALIEQGQTMATDIQAKFDEGVLDEKIYHSYMARIKHEDDNTG